MMINRSEQKKYKYTGLLITVFAFITYTTTLSSNYMGDGIQFAMAIEIGNLKNLLHPNHMLYPVLGRIFYRSWQLFGWQEGALFPLQVLSAFGGSVTVGSMFCIGQRITKSLRLALMVALGFGFSHATWLYSTDAEAVTIPLALNLVILYLLLSKHETPQKYDPLIFGFLCSLSIIVYQTGVFLVAVVVVSYLMSIDTSWRVKQRQIIVFVITTSLITGFVYLLVGFFVLDLTNVQGFLDWQFHMSRFGQWGKVSFHNLIQGGYAFLRTLAGYQGLGPSVRTTHFLANASFFNRLIFGIYYSFVFAIAITPLLLAVKMRRKLLRSNRKDLAILATWGFFFGCFATYWVPGDIQFWVIVIVPWWLLIGILLGLNTNSDVEKANPLIFFRIRSVQYVASVITVCLLLNFFTTILPNLNPRSNPSYQIATSVKAHTSDDDLIITTGGDGLFLNIPYFAKRQTESVYHQILYTNQSKAAVFASIDQEIRRVHSNGGQVFLVGVYPGNAVWWDHLQSVGLTQEDFNRFKCKFAWQIYGENVLEILP